MAPERLTHSGRQQPAVSDARAPVAAAERLSLHNLLHLTESAQSVQIPQPSTGFAGT